MPFDFGDGIGGSRRIREQMGDLFNPQDPNPEYADSSANMFHVPRITMGDYQQSSPQDDFLSGLSKYANQPSPSMDAYREYLKKTPDMNDYKPNWMTRIAAGLSGAAAGYRDPAKGIETAMKINRSGYDSALADYATHGKTLGEAAKLESDDQDNILKYYMQAGALQNTANKNQHDWAAQQETGRWHNRTAANSERQTDYNIESGNKRLGMEQNNYNSLGDYRKGLLGQGNQRLGIERGQLGVSQQNARTNIFNAMKPHYEAPPTAGELDTAQQSAMADMAPTHPGLVMNDPNRRGSYVLKPPPDVGTPEYFQYQRDLKALQDEATRRAHGSINLMGGGGGSQYQPIPDDGEEQ